ncbi:DUF4139 domain-containing protein [bacterium]|nr:DUF4139 domain-containing protein [bacterium]
MQRLLMLIVLIPLSLAAQEVSLTVYNQNRALVREVRKLKINKGQSEISFTDVAAQIDPTSVHFKSITSPGKLKILEQNFEYDLVGTQKIMAKYIDQQIRIVMQNGEIFEGVLLGSANDVILKQDDGHIRIISRARIQHFDFPALPEGLITRPTLIWKVDNLGKAAQTTEISYLTSGISWHAEYVAVVGKNDNVMDLSAWVSIDNRSGATYADATLKLVAGKINLVRQGSQFSEDNVEYALKAAPRAAGFQEKSFFEYHLYTLGRPATLKQNQIKQISLFPSATTPVTKRFIYDGARQRDKVAVMLEFFNGEKSGLGMPLPKGKLRVYKADDDGSLEFIGEDRIDHTPRDEDVRITMGYAFDLKGSRRVVEQTRPSDRSREEQIEIVLKNHKDDDVIMRASEHAWGSWKIKAHSHEFEIKDSSNFYFDVKVPARKDVTITYTILSKW